MKKRTTVFLTILVLIFSFNFASLKSVKSSQGSTCGQCIEYFPNGDRVIAGNQKTVVYTCCFDWYNGLKGAFFVSILDQDDSKLKSSYWLWGNGLNKVVDMAVTESHIYVIVNTTSTDLPQNRTLSKPTYNVEEHKEKAYIVCFTKELQIVWSSYFGGNKKDQGNAIKIDSNGDVRILFTVQSQNLPVLHGEPSTCYKNDESHRTLYLATVSEDGSSILRSTYLNKFNGIGYSMDIDKNDNTFISGTLFSKDVPKISNSYSIPKCGSYGFVSMLDKIYDIEWVNLLSDKIKIENSFESFTSVFSVAVNEKEEIFVTGATTSKAFPTTDKAIQDKPGANHEAFLCSFSYDGNIVWSSYFGGRADIYGLKILPGTSNNIIVTGIVMCKYQCPQFDSFYNMQNSYQRFVKGNNAFIATISSNGEEVFWSTLYGGSNTDIIYDFALNPFLSTISLVGGVSSSRIPFFGDTNLHGNRMNMLLITDNEYGGSINVDIIN